jgi:hypothetical protein
MEAMSLRPSSMKNRRSVRGGFALAALAALALVAVVSLSHMSSRRYVPHPRLPHVDANVYVGSSEGLVTLTSPGLLVLRSALVSEDFAWQRGYSWCKSHKLSAPFLWLAAAY